MTDRIPWWRRIWRKAAETMPPVTLIQGMNQHSWRKWDFKTYAQEGYEQNPYVFRAVNFISNGIGSLEWMALELHGDDVVELDPMHPLHQILRRPNPYTGGSLFFQALASHLLIGGTAYAVKVGPQESGEPREMYTLVPDAVKIVEGDRFKPIAAFEHKPNQRTPKQIIEPEKMIYLRLFNALDPLNGFPPLAAAARAVDQINEAQTWNMSLLKNSGSPAGAWVVSGTVDEEVHNRVKYWVKHEVAGAVNAGTMPVLSGDITFQKFGLDPAEMEYASLIQIGAREISLVFNMPPKLLFDSEDQNYASLREAKTQAWTEAILPLADMIEDELNVQLAKDFGENIVITYDRDKIEALTEERGSLWQRVSGATMLTLNEQRAELGYEEREDGDVILVPAGSVPLDDVTGAILMDDDE